MYFKVNIQVSKSETKRNEEKRFDNTLDTYVEDTNKNIVKLYVCKCLL